MHMFFKIVVLRNFPIFTGKCLCWIHFLIMLQALRLGTLFKRDFNTVVFLGILQNLYEQLFYRTPPVASVDFLFLIKINVGWFLLIRFVDLLRVSHLPVIIRNHFNTLLLIHLQKTKTWPSKAL